MKSRLIEARTNPPLRHRPARNLRNEPGEIRDA